MERRRAPRRARRLPVRFWKRGEDEPRSGYLTNISASGMFLTTLHPLPRGSRVRLEIVEPQTGFVVEGVVTHALKVAPALQQVKPSGMGLRFVEVGDLVDALLTAAKGQAPAAEGPPADGVYALRFENARQFLEIYRRELQWGGLFVPTRYPAEVNARVTVEIHSPGDGVPVRLEARVVQNAADGAARPPGAAPGLAAESGAGMGVVFTDLDAALAALKPLAMRLS